MSEPSASQPSKDRTAPVSPSFLRRRTIAGGGDEFEVRVLFGGVAQRVAQLVVV